MNNEFRALVRGLLFASVIFCISCGIIYLFNKGLWITNLAIVCLCIALGFLFGFLDAEARQEKALREATENPNLIEDDDTK